MSMLGLGDIVIPGIFVALMLRFDAQHKLASTPYFYANLLAYEVRAPGAYPRPLFALRAFSAVFLPLQPPTEGPARSKSHARSSVWA